MYFKFSHYFLIIFFFRYLLDTLSLTIWHSWWFNLWVHFKCRFVYCLIILPSVGRINKSVVAVRNEELIFIFLKNILISTQYFYIISSLYITLNNNINNNNYNNINNSNNDNNNNSKFLWFLLSLRIWLTYDVTWIVPMELFRNIFS